MPRVYSVASDDHRDWWGQRDFPSKTATIIEADNNPRFSGLYDASGNRLMVADVREPIGFVHFHTK